MIAFVLKSIDKTIIDLYKISNVLYYITIKSPYMLEFFSPLNIIDRKKSESFSVVIIERQFRCTHETERFRRIFMMIQAN
ncbi:hypothetical protein DERF_008631 [Dermatophagoides farinae]|uniref:Uncharacterized protein n=1 Tax=Dermatophagoides farinae TaxID=6954 RepID=A0A922I224_DERFA|nr:hypothetical protein DERF_008631 [Dermatophagoides farinae]